MNTNTTDNVDLGYGFTKAGVAKKPPGRKLNPNATRTVYLVDGKPFVSAGKPSFEMLKTRLQVEVPKGQEYDAKVHGPGIRSPHDDRRVTQTLESRAKHKAKVPAAGPSVAENSVSISADVVNKDTETVTV